MSEEKPSPDQAQKFKDAARKTGADEDEERWTERLRKLVGRPAPKHKKGRE